MNRCETEPADLRQSVNPASIGAAFCLAASVGYTASNILQRALVADTFQPLIIGVKESVTVLTVGPWLLWFWFRGRSLWPPRRIALRLALVGLATQVLGNLNLLFAFHHLGMAVTMPVVMGMNLSCSALFGRIFLGELVTRRTVLALGMLVLSVVLLSAGAGSGAAIEPPESNPAGGHSVGWGLLGALAAIVAGVTFATTATGIRASVTAATSTSATVFIITAMGVVSLGPVCLLHLGVDGLAAVPQAKYGFMVAAGVLNLVAFVSITIGLRHTSVARANLLNASQVALATVAGVVCFQEKLTFWVIAGVSLTIVGMILIEPGNAPLHASRTT